jgi:hypothetical protein
MLKDVSNPLVVLDNVVWASLDDAMAAAKAVEEEASTAPFVQAIEEFILLSHYDPTEVNSAYIRTARLQIIAIVLYVSWLREYTYCT